MMHAYNVAEITTAVPEPGTLLLLPRGSSCDHESAMRKPVFFLLTALAAACASPDGPFTAVGRPAMPLYEARPHCKEKTRSVSSNGTVATDWAAYERCMADLGWIKQTSPGSASPAPTGGGRPSY
jgi:hypothetical protein